MKKHHFPLSPLFIIICLFIGFFVGIKEFVIYFFVVFLHEIAHFFMAKRLGYKLKNAYIMPYGVCLNFDSEIFYGNDEIYIALAGPVFNIFLCLICVCLWWCFPETYYYLDYFCFCNLMLGAFNLIPCFPLDGGRVFVALLSKKHNRQNIIKLSIIVNYFASALLLVLFLTSIFGEINFTYLFIAIFLFSGTVNPEKYSSFSYSILNGNTKKIQKDTQVKIFAVSSSLPLFKIVSRCSKTKFNIVYVVFNTGEVRVLSEINLANLCSKYPVGASIDTIRQTSIKID